MGVENDGVALPRLYSAGGIKLLSLLFSSVAGGVMTAQNLKDINQPRAARVALWGSIAYTVAVLFLSTKLLTSAATPWLSWPINLIGGLALEAYFKRFVPDWIAFPSKSNLKPILISLAATAAFVGALAGILVLANGQTSN